MIKVAYLFRRLARLSPGEFSVYWKDVHGPLGARIPGLRRLVQSHALPADTRPADFDGMAELWFDDAEALRAARSSPEWRASTEDEARFIEPGSGRSFVSAEHEVMIPTTTSGSPRLVVLAVIANDAGEILLCRMPPSRPFPNCWALPGGGVEPGEGLDDAVRREASEELGLRLVEPEPHFFVEGRHEKTLPDGSRIQRHMVFLVFRARAEGTAVTLNPEFDAHAWVAPERLGDYTLNPATRTTLGRLGLV